MKKTAYEMRISDWSSDVCSSDLCVEQARRVPRHGPDRVDRIVAHGPVHRPWCAGPDAVRHRAGRLALHAAGPSRTVAPGRKDRKSAARGKSVSVRVDIGGRRIFKKTE